MLKSLTSIVLFVLSVSFVNAAEFQLSTHVLDTTLGKPGTGVDVNLEKRAPDGTWIEVGKGITDQSGRIGNFLKIEKDVSHVGVYRFTFSLEKYFATRGLETVYPEAVIVFKISDATHYHIPLIVTPYALSTYRGN
jgi:5-hydroxyisourate hydrolase